MVRGQPLHFAQFLPFFRLFGNGSKSPKNTLGVVDNFSKACRFCFLTVFKNLRKWPKSSKMVRGQPLLFDRFSPYFQLFKTGSKRPKTTIGVVENNSKAFTLCFRPVFKKLKKWPKSTKMVRGYPLLFDQFLPFFPLFENASKSRKMTLGVVENDSKAFSPCF